MTTRDSSVNAIAELRTLRLARVRERARVEAERRTEEQAARQRQLREERAARIAAARATAPEPEPARPSRTTLERIGDMRLELRALARERAEANAERDARIERLMVRVSERRSTWAPIATALVVAAGVFGALAMNVPGAPVVSTTVPEAPTEFEQALEASPPATDMEDASEVALLEEAEIPLLDGDAGVPAAEAATDARPAPKRKKVTRPRKKPKRPPAAKAPERPALDALGNLDGCGDDPICGLGL